MLEAAVVGLIASVIGLAAGVGVAAGLKMLLVGASASTSRPVAWCLTTRTVIVSLVAGLGVSLASAVLPARRAAKVPPIAAMREVAVDKSGSSRRRAMLGLDRHRARRSRHGCRSVRWGRHGAGRRWCRC